MQKFSHPFGHVHGLEIEHPERTGYRVGKNSDMSGDVYFQVWPSEAAMRATIRMQERGPSHWSHWKPYKESRWYAASAQGRIDMAQSAMDAFAEPI